MVTMEQEERYQEAVRRTKAAVESYDKHRLLRYMLQDDQGKKDSTLLDVLKKYAEALQPKVMRNMGNEALAEVLADRIPSDAVERICHKAGFRKNDTDARRWVREMLEKQIAASLPQLRNELQTARKTKKKKDAA